MKKRALLLGVALLASLPALLHAAPLTIENGLVRVEYDPAQGRLAFLDPSSGKPFAKSVGWGESKSIEAHVIPIIQGPPGVTSSGQAIELTAGNKFDVMLFPGCPFVLVRETFQNRNSSDFPLVKLWNFQFTARLDAPATNLMVRGTGGVNRVDEYQVHRTWSRWFQIMWAKLTRHPLRPPGASYRWLAVADPKTQNGIVTGWVTQDRATALVVPAYDSNLDKVMIGSFTQWGLFQAKPEAALDVGTLAIGHFDDVRIGLEQYADLVAKANHVRLPPQPAGYCTWYADQHGKSSDEKSLAELSDFVAKNLKPYGMSFVQIDDGWQLGDSHGNGPNKNFTGSNPNGPYSSGMKAAADRIKADGLTPGLWFIPFGGTKDDPWFADKQNLFLKAADGKPIDTKWGGTCLDMTHWAAQKYVHDEVHTMVHDWGFGYLKIDGLFTGIGARQLYINYDYLSTDDDGWGDGILSDPTQTHVEAFRDGLTLIRDAAGPNVFLLGCNTAQNMRVYGASMGLVDAMRIGPDNAGDWKSWLAASPVYGSRNYFLNGRVWYNDPDPCYVRASLTLDEARTEASWTAISGQLYANSDWLPGLPPERLDIIKRTVAPHGQLARPVDFLENDPPRVWQVIEPGPKAGAGIADRIVGYRRDVVALFNWTDHDLTIDVPLAKLDLPKAGRYAAFDFWANQFLPDVTDTISQTLPPHSCRIIALRALRDHPAVLSTSANVTQGMIDLLEEHWDPETKTLSGKSKVIAGDPYELRIAAPDSFQKWTSFEAAPADPSVAGSTITNVTQDPGHRAGFTSTVAEDVSWKLTW